MNLTEIGYFQVEGHRIELRSIGTPNFDWYYFHTICAAELYGILRTAKPLAIAVYEFNGFNYFHIRYEDNLDEYGEYDREAFSLSDFEMDQFFFYYCNMPRKAKIDWKEHGF